ncbi:amino acid ABC transporter permease [Solibacillus sp. FSL R7-0668]|uniref:amino acid ABC transporter permease n=1 Tax=Solibacillus sp. FSL R7-0668 TaxID=2921688 RepID=UPI0030FCF712
MEKYFDMSYIWAALPDLLPYLWVTLYIVAFSVIGGSLFGFVLAAAKLSNNQLLRALANAYTTVMRCTPAIVLLFLVYYGIPAFAEGVFGIYLQDVSTGVFVVVTFSLQFAAMMSEVIRSSYLAIDKGQFEAAVSVGLTPFQAYRRIIFPQALVVALPNFGNGLISVLQEGALAYTIGFIDIVGKANLIIANNYGTHTLEIYIALAVIYWVLSISIEKLFAVLEKMLSKGKQTIKTT